MSTQRRASRAWTRAIGLGVLASLVLGACANQQRAEPEPQPTREPEVRPEPRPATPVVYSPRLGNEQTAVRLAFPTGDLRTSAIMLHQVVPTSAQPGENFTYEFHVTNLTDGTLQNVVVAQQSKQNLTVTGSTPQGAEAGDQITWAIGELGPRETRIVRVDAEAESVGLAGNCVGVSYNNYLCATIPVVQPDLELAKSATREALVCDEILLRYQVRNTGSGPARSVRIRETLPEGLTTVEGGRRQFELDAGDLAPGESRSFEVRAKAAGTGEFTSGASAVAAGNLTAESSDTTTLVRAPRLAIQAECTEQQYLGRNFTHTYTVSNLGDGASAGATASIQIPSGAEFVRASGGGTVQGNAVVFNLGDLDADESVNISATFRAAQSGNYASRGSVSGACAESAADTCQTRVVGISAILLEVIDLTDPVEVGEETIYEIVVTNQGSAVDNNIRITCVLPGALQLLEAGGQTNASTAGQRVSFAPLPSLAPGAQAKWTVRVRAADTGSVRFRVEMTSDQLDQDGGEAVIETEATNLYR